MRATYVANDGWTRGDLTAGVQASLDAADTAVQLGDAARPITMWRGTQAEYDALPTGTRNAAGFVTVIL